MIEVNSWLAVFFLVLSLLLISICAYFLYITIYKRKQQFHLWATALSGIAKNKPKRAEIYEEFYSSVLGFDRAKSRPQVKACLESEDALYNHLLLLFTQTDSCKILDLESKVNEFIEQFIELENNATSSGTAQSFQPHVWYLDMMNIHLNQHPTADLLPWFDEEMSTVTQDAFAIKSNIRCHQLAKSPGGYDNCDGPLPLHNQTRYVAGDEATATTIEFQNQAVDSDLNTTSLNHENDMNASTMRDMEDGDITSESMVSMDDEIDESERNKGGLDGEEDESQRNKGGFDDEKEQNASGKGAIQDGKDKNSDSALVNFAGCNSAEERIEAIGKANKETLKQMDRATNLLNKIYRKYMAVFSSGVQLHSTHTLEEIEETIGIDYTPPADPDFEIENEEEAMAMVAQYYKDAELKRMRHALNQLFAEYKTLKLNTQCPYEELSFEQVEEELDKLP